MFLAYIRQSLLSWQVRKGPDFHLICSFSKCNCIFECTIFLSPMCQSLNSVFHFYYELRQKVPVSNCSEWCWQYRHKLEHLKNDIWLEKKKICGENLNSYCAHNYECMIYCYVWCTAIILKHWLGETPCLLFEVKEYGALFTWSWVVATMILNELLTLKDLYIFPCANL